MALALLIRGHLAQFFFLFIAVSVQIPLCAQTSKYELILEARDTIWLGSRVADEFIPLERSDGKYLVYSDSLFLCSTPNCRPLYIPGHHSIISPSISFHGNTLGFYRSGLFHVFDVEQNRTIDSFKPDLNYNALINSSHQNRNSFILINHYPKDHFDDLGHDQVKIFTYDKRGQKVIGKVLLNIGPEILLAALNFQLHAFGKQHIYIGLPLSGQILVLDKENLELKDTLLPKSLMSSERQAFFDTFLSKEKLATYRNQSKKLIGDYYQSIDSTTEVLSKVIHYTEAELLLVYKNPVNHQPSLYLFKLKDKSLHEVDTRDYYSNPLFASRKVFINAQRQLELCHLETTTQGLAYFLVNKYGLRPHTGDSLSPSRIWSDKNLWPNADALDYFLIIEPSNFCSGCFDPDKQKQILFILSERLLKRKGVSTQYLERYYRRLYKNKTTLYFVPDNVYQALRAYYPVNTRLKKTSAF